MKKPEIRVDQQEASDSEALKHKDFNKVLGRANGGNSSGNRLNVAKVLGAVILVVGTIGGILWLMQDEKVKEPVIEEQRIGVQRPFPEIAITYEVFEIIASVDEEITTAEGSVIVIPKNCLVNKEGQPIVSKVQLKYQEFRDMIDVFLSGIPMTYDSAGQQFHFQSAGMFELFAEQNGAEVFVRKGKSIQVYFASDYIGDQFNIYHYLPEENNWNFMYKDIPVELPDSVEDKVDFVVEEVDEIDSSDYTYELYQIIEPQSFTKNLFKIKLDIIKEEFPEIYPYKNVKFQVIDDQGFDPELAKLEWDLVVVKRVDGNQYLLHFERGKQVEEFYCIPVFDKEDYESAMNVFNQQVKEAQLVPDDNKQKRKALRDQLRSNKQSQRTTLQTYKDRKKYGSEARATQVRISRMFTIQSFGIYNSDCPKSLPQGVLLTAKLHDKKEKVDTVYLEHNNVFLVEKDQNALYTYYSINQFAFNPTEKTMMWTVTKNNQLAIYSYPEFSELSVVGKGEEYAFQMEIIDVKFSSEKEIRKYLEL
ncbi:MAG: hypothetical protein JKY42_04100 [Flavobacteriales bacterium]|nr:hypothetical protein [Flavobacteriales bacterium]